MTKKNLLRSAALACAAMMCLCVMLAGCKKKTEVTLQSIAVTTPPTKTTYVVDETFNTAGMVVTASYSDKSSKPVTVTSAMLDYDFKTAGTKTVTISYTEKGKTATTTVSGITVTDKGTSDPDKSVSVDGQNGTMTAGKAEAVSFDLTTTGIENGSYGATVANLPAGVTVKDDVLIRDGEGILILEGDGSQTAGSTATLTLTIDGAVSGTFTLVILSADAKSVTVSEQTSTMTAGAAGTAHFNVTTINIADGSYEATVANLPAGVTVQGNVVIAGNSGNLLLEGDGSQTEGATATLTLTIDGTVSKAFTLTVSSSTAKSVSVGAQVGTLEAKTPGTVTFPITAANIADNTYTATVTGRPSGVTFTDTEITITSGSGTLIIGGNTFTNAGTYWLNLTLDDITSASFPLAILPPPFAGAGTIGSPYQIGTLAELQEMRTRVNNNANSGHYRTAHYEQTAAITLSGTWTPIGTTSTNSFNGVYDGGDYVISNMNITGSSDERGLFGYVNHADAVIKNVRMTNVNISGDSRVGGVVGYLLAGTVEYCRVSGGSISGTTNIGGVAGSVLYSATVQNCYVSGVSITGSGNAVGGVAGYNTGTVQNCYSTANVTGDRFAGGVAGYVDTYGTVEYCYATGAITATYDNAGGIVGINEGTINRCVALNPSVTSAFGADRIGRVAGSDYGTMTSNYARSSGMTLTYGGTAYTPTVTTAVHDGKDGLDVSAADTHGSASNVWWRPAAQFGTMQWSATTWSFGSNRLPILQGFDGDTQNPTVE